MIASLRRMLHRLRSFFRRAQLDHNLDSLVLFWENRGIDEGPDARRISPGDATDIRANSQLFEDVATYQCADFNLSSEGRLDVTTGCRVSANFFSVLGAVPTLGRL